VILTGAEQLAGSRWRLIFSSNTPSAFQYIPVLEYLVHDFQKKELQLFSVISFFVFRYACASGSITLLAPCHESKSQKEALVAKQRRCP
jgi:hypothetical protein